MSKTIPRSKVTSAIIEALDEAERKYKLWTRGSTMRAAPESFVQTQVAEKLHGLGLILLLEASVADIASFARDGEVSAESDLAIGGRFDIVAYYHSRQPRFIIEIKKLNSKNSLNADCERIRRVMAMNKGIQNGLLVGYGTAVHEKTILNRIQGCAQSLAISVVQTLAPQEVRSKKGLVRKLAGAVFRVDSGDA